MLSPNHPAAPNLKSEQWWADVDNSHQVAHTIYKSVVMVLMADAIPPTKKADWVGLLSFKYTVQKLFPFSMNAEWIYGQLAAKLIVVRPWRRMITTTRPRRICQHLLITVIQLQLGCHSGDIPGSQIFHKVTARMPVYMPMPLIDQHRHTKT